MSLLIKNASQVVCISTSGERVKKGEAMRSLNIIENGAVVIKDGLIIDVGPTSEIVSRHNESDYQIIDATGKCVLPGLVDAHTHPVFSGDRVHEFAMKLEGATYMDIQRAGGGIIYTMNSVANSTEQELYELLIPRLDRMLNLGTTLLEAKSGYGLNFDHEAKMLKVLHRANKDHIIDIVSTYLPAHAVVPGKTPTLMADEICSYDIPKMHELKEEGLVNPEMIDVFCEKEIFEIEETRKILTAGRYYGLHSNFHGEELHKIESAVMGGHIQARAISHLEHVSDQGIQSMAENGVIGILLPVTQNILKLKVPPARKMIDSQIPVALGTDFCPNAWCLSMPLAMHMACINYSLRMDEALVAATLNSAASMGRSEHYGSIEVGKYGDLIILGADRWEHLIYQLVDPPIEKVIKKGRIVINKS